MDVNPTVLTISTIYAERPTHKNLTTRILKFTAIENCNAK